MKSLKTIILLVVLTFLSCSKKNEQQSIGKWDDNIKLSQKKVEFSNKKSSVKITTKGKWWWIDNLQFNGRDIEFDREKTNLENFIIEKTEFKIERKNSQEIYINMNENKTNKDRTLIISLEAGDYFDGIKVTQKR